MLEFLQKLAAAMGLDPATITDETAGMELVMQGIQTLIDQAKAGEKKPEETKTPAGTAQAGGAAAAATGASVRKETVTREFAASQQAAEKPNPMLVKTLMENRELKLSRLVDEGRITPAQKEELAKAYVTEEVVGLALSSGSDGSDFDNQIRILGMNQPANIGKAKTGIQGGTVASLSNGAAGKPAESGLIADAKARAAAAQKK